MTYPIVALRCFARWNVTSQIWYDDWAALVATLFLMMLGGIEIYSAFPPECRDSSFASSILIGPGTEIGFGDHYWNISVSNGETLLKVCEKAINLTRSNAMVAILRCPNELCSGPGLRQSLYSPPISSRFPSTVVQDSLQDLYGFHVFPWPCLSSRYNFPMLTYLLDLGPDHNGKMCKHDCRRIFWGDLQHR